MSLKDEIIRIALVGTQRSKLSEVHKTKLQELGIDTTKSDEEIILSSISLLSLAEKASFTPTLVDVSTIEKLDTSDEKACSLRSVQHLYSIMDGTYKNALPEFLETLSLYNKQLPAEVLPEVLDNALSSPSLWKLLQANIGIRGEWLITQNPAWQSLTPQHISTTWDEANNEERLALILSQKTQNPAQVMAWLQESWDTESVSQKLKYLERIQTLNAPDWEQFLEDRLDERHKNIRQVASQLLALVPKSAFYKRMKKRAKAMITSKGGLLKAKKLSINLDVTVDDAWIRDGISPNVKWYNHGIKASRLGQVVAILPPSFWKNYLEVKPKQIVSLFAKSDYSQLLFQALIEATSLHQDEEWASVLLDYLAEQQGADKWDNIKIKSLQTWIPDTVFNTSVLKILRENPSSIATEDSLVVQLLKDSSNKWDKTLTVALTECLIKDLSKKEYKWNTWHYKHLFNKAAYQCAIETYPEVNRSWQYALPHISSWTSEIETFLSILYFRKQMIQELQRE